MPQLPRFAVVAPFLILTFNLLLVAASPARAQLLEYSGAGEIVGTDGPAPDRFTPEGGSFVDYTFVFDASSGPVATTDTSATYAGVYGLVGFGADDIRTLDDVTLTITRDTAHGSYDYLFTGVTPEGWRVVHNAFSSSPDFVPSLALPTESPAFPPDGYAAGYVDVYGPANAWSAYSDAEMWFAVSALTLENRATGGIATASKQKLSESAAHAFDGSTSTKWFASSVSTAWLQYQFSASQAWAVVRYDITSARDVANRDPRDWEFQGSHDGVTWTTLDTRSGEMFAARRQTKQYTLTNSTAYEYYRLNITATRGVGAGIQLAELALMAY